MTKYANALHKALIVDIKGPLVPDTSVTWLRRHRATVAFVLCVCSGPWRIERRQKVQAQALAVIGSADLTDSVMRRKLVKLLPLTWQKTLVKDFAAWMRKHGEGELFDTMFHRSGRKDTDVGIETLQEITGKVNLPKTVWMFVRDYWRCDCWPVDRHVRRWCERNQLPKTSAELVALFHEIPKERRGPFPLRCYARAVFGEHAANPIFPAQ